MNSIIASFFRYIDVSERTQAAYRNALRQLFKFLTERSISEPSRNDILSFRHHLEARNRKPGTIALYLAACRRFFAWTEHAGLYPNIALGVKAPKQEPGPKRDCLCADQLRTILNSIDRTTPLGRRNFAILALMSVGGLRTIELVRANIDDLRRIGNHTCLFVQGKGRNSKAEFVKLPAPVLKAVREYLADRGHPGKDAPLFVSMSFRNRNSRLSTRSISFICKSAMRKNGFNSARLTAHSLWHSAITISLLAGLPLSDVQAFARHKSINTTMIYAHHVDRLSNSCEDTICNAVFQNFIRKITDSLAFFGSV